MRDRTRGRSKKKVKQGLPWLDQVKAFAKATRSIPAKLFLEDIFVPTKGGKITNESFSEGALDLLSEIVKSKTDGPGEVVVDYDDYNKFGSELSANFFGVEENQNPDLISRLANLNPADELKFTLGTAKVKVDEKGRAKVEDQYDFNSWAYYGEGLNEDGQYNTYTPEEFEELDLGFAEAIKDTLANSPSKYQATRNIGFLLGSKDYKDSDKDSGRKVEIDLGTVIAPEGSAVKTSPRPSPRPSTRKKEKEEFEEALKEAEEVLKGSMLPETEDPDLSDLRSYLDNLPEGPAEVTESPRPMPRPREEVASGASVEAQTDMVLSEGIQTSPRPMPRPEPTPEPKSEAPINTDEMSFGDAFKYYVDNTDQEVFTWRGKDYKAERAFNKGGLAEQTKSLFNEGGMADDGMEIDPVSGNEIPPGSTAKEVRDTVDAKLSEGEYVVPADVVQYYGVKFFEDLRTKAKTDLKDMDDRGRIGGEPQMGSSEDLTPEEMAMLQEAMSEGPIEMAEGGIVKRPAFLGNFGSSGFETRQYVDPSSGQVRSFMFLDGQPVVDIPEGFVPYTEGFKEQQEKEKQEEQKVETEGTRDSGNDRGEEERFSPESSRDSGRNSWNPGVDLTDPEQALEYAKSQSEMGLGQKVAGAGAMLGGPLGLAAGAFSAASQLESISNIRAAAQIQEAQGNTEKAKEIRNLTKGFKIEGGMIDDIFASGSQKYESYMTDPSLGGGLSRENFKSDEDFEKSLQKYASPGMTWTGSSYQRIDNDDPGSPGGGSSGIKTSPRPKPRPGSSSSTSGASSGASSRPSSRPSSSTQRDDKDDPGSPAGTGGGFGPSSPGFGGLYNKGGLVKKPSKPQKKKPTKKRGLASRPNKK